MADVTTFMIFAPADKVAYFGSAPAAFEAWMVEAFPRFSFSVLPSTAQQAREREAISVSPYQSLVDNPEDPEWIDPPSPRALEAMAERAASFLIL